MNNYETGLELGIAIAQSSTLYQRRYEKNGQTYSCILYERDSEYLDLE